MDDRGIKLSVVATSRNDDHGANLRRRMQTFVNAFISQCRRHDLRAELILVEWNPPADRPRLAEVLRWPDDPSPCEVRIIEVPETLHRRLKHSAALPLFQMIAKNVGIRRARGQFILATNIDIVFNDELMRFIKEGKLETGKVYRIDRTDVETDVPVDAPIEEQLAYCRSHHLRLNSAYGTFPLDSQGMMTLSGKDVAAPGSGIIPVHGSSMPEPDGEGGIYRWAGADICLSLTPPVDRPCRLLAEVSPGPCVRSLPAELEVLDKGKVVARGKILGRVKLALDLPLMPGCGKFFNFRVREGGYFPPPNPADSRVLDLAIHRLSWSDAPAVHPRPGPADAFQILPAELHSRDIISSSAGIRLGMGWHGLSKRFLTKYRWADSGAGLTIDRESRAGRALHLWVAAGRQFHSGPTPVLQLRDGQDRVLASTSLGPRPDRVTLAVPAESGSRVFLHVLCNGAALTGKQALRAFRVFSCSWSDASWGRQLAEAAHGSIGALRSWTRSLLWWLAEILPSRFGYASARRFTADRWILPRLHTNACGDFMLMAREHWFEMCGYTELEIFSMHLDSLFLYAAHVAGLEEVVLPTNMRAYHIEHSAGSGWTPEGESRLFERLRAKGIPALSHEEICEMAHSMTAQGNPRLFHTHDWGLVHESLPETRIAKPRDTLAA
jgi:hypothetical protein